MILDSLFRNEVSIDIPIKGSFNPDGSPLVSTQTGRAKRMAKSELTDVVFGDLKYKYVFLIKDIDEPVEGAKMTYLGNTYEVLSVRECIDIHDTHQCWRVAT